jgi:hypothetical protein
MLTFLLQLDVITDQEVQGRACEAQSGEVQPRPSAGSGGVGALGSGCEQGLAIHLQREAGGRADSGGHQDGGCCNRWPVAAIASQRNAVVTSGI